MCFGHFDIEARAYRGRILQARDDFGTGFLLAQCRARDIYADIDIVIFQQRDNRNIKAMDIERDDITGYFQPFDDRLRPPVIVTGSFKTGQLLEIESFFGRCADHRLVDIADSVDGLSAHDREMFLAICFGMICHLGQFLYRSNTTKIRLRNFPAFALGRYVRGKTNKLKPSPSWGDDGLNGAHSVATRA